MEETMLLICPECKAEANLPANMAIGKNIRCSGCGKRLPYSSYINPEAERIKQQIEKEQAYASHVEEARNREKTRRAIAMERHQRRLQEEAAAKAERIRLEAEAKAKAEAEAKAKAEAEAERIRLEAEAKAKAEAERQRQEAEAKAKAEAEAKAKAEAEAERIRLEAARKNKEKWAKEGRYANIGMLQLANDKIVPLKEGDNIIGRGQAVSIIIPDSTNQLSREHLVVTVREEPGKGYVHEASLVKEKVNATFILRGNQNATTKMVYGQTYVLRKGDSISVPVANIELHFIVNEKATRLN